MKKIISTVLALTMVSNMALVAMADEFADVEATETVIELTEDNSQPADDTQAELLSSGDVVLKQSPDKIQKVKAGIDDATAGPLDVKTHTFDNFKVNMNSKFAQYEHFSIEEESGNKFVRMAGDEFSYDTNPVSNVEFTMASAREYIVSYRFRFSKMSTDWFEAGIGSSRVNLVFSGKRIAMNYGYSDFKNGTGNVAAYKARYQELYGKAPGSQEWTLCGDLEEGVWYTVTLKVNLNSAADGGQCFDFAVVSDNTATVPKDISIERVPFRGVGNASENIGTLKFIAPHYDAAKKSSAYQLDIDDVESYAVPKEVFYFDVTGPATLADGNNTVVTNFDNRTGSTKNIKEYFAISEDGVLKDVQEKNFTAINDGEHTTWISFDADQYTGAVTYEAFVLDADTGATLALKGGEGGTAPSDFITTELGYGKIIANVAAADTYGAGFVTVYDKDGKVVYMADVDCSDKTSVEYSIPEGTPEGNYTFEITLSNADGDAVTETADIEYKKDAYIVEQFNAENADIGALIATYGEAIGLDLSGEYATKSAYINNYVAQAGPFADADGIKAAFAEAEVAAAQLPGDFTEVTAKASQSQITRDVVDFENFPTGDYDGKTQVIDKVNVNWVHADFAESEIVEEGGNKFYRLTQKAGFESANGKKTALSMNAYTDAYPSTNKAQLSYKIRFDTLNGGWHVINVGGQLASLYVSGKKFGVNFGSGHPSGLKQHVFSGAVTEGKWYTVVYDVDFSKTYDRHYDFTDVSEFNKDVYTADNNYAGPQGTFSIDIYNEDGTLFASTKNVVGDYAPFRSSANSLHLYVSPAEGSVDSSISIDDISKLSYDPAKGNMAYTVTGTKNLMPGKNILKVNFESLYASAKDVNVYVPVYVDGVIVDFVKENVTVKANGNTSADITVDVPATYAEAGKVVIYDVFVLDSLGGYNYSASSAVEAAGSVDASVKADFDTKALNITATTNLDNAVVVVLAPGKTLADAESNPVSSIIYMAETKGGNINLTTAVPDGLGEGDYTVVVTGQNASGVVTSDDAKTYYCGNDMVDTIIADFNAITTDNATTTINKYLTEYPVLSSMDENFAAYYADNTELLNGLAVSGKPYSKVSDIIAAFYTAYAIDEMKASETIQRFTEVFETNAHIYGIDITSDEYLNNKEAVLNTLYASKADISIDTIKGMFDDAVLVAEFNSATKDTAADVIGKYADKLGLDLTTEYAQYPHIVISEFVKAMPYADKAAVKTAFDDAVEFVSNLDGDYTQTVVKQSHAQEKVYALDFSEADNDAEKLGLPSYLTYTVNDESVGSAQIAEEADGNKYFIMKQEDGYIAPSDDAYAVGAVYKSSSAVGSGWSKAREDSKIGFSYRVKFEGLSTAGWTYLQINNLSSLYITSARKFGINGSGASAGSFGDISVQDDVWYNIDYVINFNTQKYDLTISNDKGESQQLKNIAFRSSTNDIVFCPWTDQHKKNGAKSYVALDDINTTVMAGNALTYKATGTKDLLPGKNTISFEFNNTNVFEETPVIYIPVYVDGVLHKVVTDSAYVNIGEKLTKDVYLDIDSSVLANSDVTYEILVLSEIGGFNYTPICFLEPEEGEEATITAEAEADFDNKVIKVNTASKYLDNMVITLLGPDGEIAYMTENDAGEVILDAYKKDTGKRTQSIDIAVNDNCGSGIYTLIVTGQDINGNPIYRDVTVYYSGNDIADDFVSDFNGATDATIETVINKYLTTYPILTSQDNRLPAYYVANKASLNSTCLAFKPYAKPSEIINTVFSAFYADELLAVETEADFVEVFEENAHYFGIDVEDENYIENKDAVIDRLYDNQEDITATEFAGMYEEALMIARFNSAGATTIEEVLNDYNEVLGLDFDKSDFTSSEYLAFRKELTKEGVTYDSTEDILDAYEDALDAADEAGSDSGSGSGGGGSSKPNKVVGGGVSMGSNGGVVSVGVDAPYVESNTQLGTNATGFVDLEGVEWAVESINALKNMGIVNGVDATHFNPNANVTREEFAKMIVAAFNVEGTGQSFADAPAGMWFTPYVNALASAGIADGVGNGNFGVGMSITRQDAAVILDKAAQYAKVEYDWDVSALYIFTDYVAPYAKESIQKLYQVGVINGTSATTFSSTDTLTRAQAAKMIYYMLQLGNK